MRRLVAIAVSTATLLAALILSAPRYVEGAVLVTPPPITTVGEAADTATGLKRGGCSARVMVAQMDFTKNGGEYVLLVSSNDRFLLLEVVREDVLHGRIWYGTVDAQGNLKTQGVTTVKEFDDKYASICSYLDPQSV